MKNLKYALFVFIVIPLLTVLYMQEPKAVASSYLAVTDTPVPSPVPTDTPVPVPDTPTPTPDDSVTVTPVPSTPTNTPDGSTPPPVVTPDDDSTPGSTPVSTPSAIPALGSGPGMTFVLFYGVALLVLFVVIVAGWVKVWQATRE